jgi:hypothetical protein
MRSWLAKLRTLLGRGRLDDELRAEMETHLEMAILDEIDRGVAPPDARERARRTFGNATLIHESAREAWMLQAVIHFVTPGFFETLGIPLVRGRSFDDGDDADAPRVTVIGESLADRLWPEQDPLGRQLTMSGVTRTVVGVARNIAVRTIENASDAQIYFPGEQLGATSIYYAPKDLLVRAGGNAAALAPAVRAIVHGADAAQAVSDVRLLDDLVRAQSAPRRDQLLVLGTFAAIAFLLAGIGIHGLLSFAVSSRLQEVGVRVALGAARRRILRMFLEQGMVLGVAGIAIGAPLAYLSAGGMRRCSTASRLAIR